MAAAGKRVLICFSAVEVEQDCVCGFFKTSAFS
jgi:hypothetical protein